MTVYCGSCGAAIRETARFCPACGSAQIPLPVHSSPPSRPAPAPAGLPAPAPLAGSELIAATLAVLGGAAMCFVAIYATVYLPLDNGFPVDYGVSPRLGDLVALISGGVAIALGVMIATRRSPGPTASRAWLVAAGSPTLVMALLWAFPQTFHLSYYPPPFYFAFLYFTDLGTVRLGEGSVGLPLLAGCAMVVAAGFAAAAATPGAIQPARLR